MTGPTDPTPATPTDAGCAVRPSKAPRSPSRAGGGPDGHPGASQGLTEPHSGSAHHDAIRAIEDAIDATAERRSFGYESCGCLIPTERTAEAILDALIEQGWTPPQKARPGCGRYQCKRNEP